MTAIDRHSETWKAIEGWAKAELDKATPALERATTNRNDTQNLRGRIAVLRDLLKMGEVPKPSSGPPAKPSIPYA